MKRAVPRKILVIHRKGGLGDLLLASAVPAALKDAWPDAEITFHCPAGGEDLLERCPFIDHIQPVPDTGSVFLEQVRSMRSRRYDLGLVLWGTTRDAWLLFLSGVQTRVGNRSKLLYSFMFNRKVKVRTEYNDLRTHWVEVLLDYVRAIGLVPGPPRVTYILQDRDIQEALELLDRRGVGRDELLIGFHIGKGITGQKKEWPVDAFISMARSILDAFPCRLALTGTESEKELIRRMQKGLGEGAVDLCGLTTIATLGGLISQCKVFVCPDSFPMHLAAALNVPTVGIFTLKSDVVERWRPLGERVQIVRPSDVECRDRCIKEQCEDYKCYRQIKPADIASAIDRLMT
ncbi:glycosyltransferase family 9 protein [Acidobacteriota bacterium]